MPNQGKIDAVMLFYHVFNVYVKNKFMGKKWEKNQMKKLVNKQQIKIAEIKAWLLANGINFVFIIIISALLVYWMIQLVRFDKTGEEDKDPSAHSFL